MRYTENDIFRIPLTEFLAALGEKSVKSFENMMLYYAPHRDDPEPTLVVYTNTNRWFDHSTEERGNIIDLARLKMNPLLYKDPKEFILKYMNEYEQGKEHSATAHRLQEPITVGLDIKNVKLTDFMKAIGQGHPVSSDGNLRVYKAPYDDNHEPTMVINTETNLWRDTKSGAYGGIYDLAYELTGSCNMRELNMYIASEMSNIRNVGTRRLPKEPPKEYEGRSNRKMGL